MRHGIYFMLILSYILISSLSLLAFYSHYNSGEFSLIQNMFFFSFSLLVLGYNLH